jgi:peptidoglycan endopeptidase LytE
MKKTLILMFLWLLVTCSAFAQTAGEQQPPAGDFFTKLKTVATKHLGRPYVWGASGMKSFDCSGFIWRVMFEGGILLKRTTARKFYMTLPAVPEEDRDKFGTFVFFDNLKHVGIVDTPSTFYHAQLTRGTNLSPLNSFWRRRIYGFRAIPVPTEMRIEH